MPNRYEKAGRLDRRITIQRATTVSDAYGTPVATWADLACCWAHLAYSETGSAEEQHDAVHLAITRTIFTIRYRDDLLHPDRIAYGGNHYDIIRIAESAGPFSRDFQATRRAYLTITAELRK